MKNMFVESVEMINQVQSVQAVTPWIFAKDLEIWPWIDLNGKMHFSTKNLGIA